MQFNKIVRPSLAILLVACVTALWGCPKKTEVASSPEPQKEATTQPATPPAAENAPSTAAETKAAEAKEAAAAAADELKPVYFDFDKAVIRDDAKEALKSNAAWLKSHPQVKIKIEGNCDDRGTIEYNQALGQRRSAGAKKYLAALGVSARRISLISYGKEKPVCSEENETCWQKNRRDDFAVVSQ